MISPTRTRTLNLAVNSRSDFADSDVSGPIQADSYRQGCGYTDAPPVASNQDGTAPALGGQPPLIVHGSLWPAVIVSAAAAAGVGVWVGRMIARLVF